ncbi:MAG: DNA methyltransferase [bacterium]
MSHLAGHYRETPLNRSEISQADLDIKNKIRSNPLHWNGQFSPQLIEVLLNRYATSETLLFDPFLGSGTILLEAGLLGIEAYGTEINPAAVLLAQTYHFINVPGNIRSLYLEKVSSLIRREFIKKFPLFQNVRIEMIKSRLIDLLSSIEDARQHNLFETLIVLLDFYKQDLSVEKLFKMWNKITELVLRLPFSEKPIKVFHADSRKTPLADSSVDLVITSPPYINVFNYHQQYRASVESLNWDLLKVAKSEIGSNRKHRGNRFLTAIQYCLDMAQTFKELARVCCSNSRLIFVVGRESTIRGTSFYNGEIVTEVAHSSLGFNLILKQERVFLNRFGQNIFEDILHFSPPTGKSNPLFLESARSIAQKILETAYSVANKAKDDIRSALENIDTVQPSPVFEGDQILSKAENTKGRTDEIVHLSW